MAPTRSQTVLLRFSRAGGLAVLWIGVAVLLSSLLRVHWLKSISPGGITMNSVSAILFIFGGIALVRHLKNSNGDSGSNQRSADRLRFVSSLIVTLGGALKLAEYFFKLDLNFDHWLFQNRLSQIGLFPETEIAPNSAVVFLLCGAGLLLIDFESRRGLRPAQLCFLLGALLALLALMGYAYQVLPLYSLGAAIPMSLISAISFELLCLAGLAARPADGLMRIITSDTTAGSISRRLLPGAILIPLLLGILRFTSERHGILEVEFGVSLFAVATVIVFAALIWWNARLLFGVEQERLRAERRLAVQYGATRALAEAVEIHDAAQAILKAVCDRMNWPAGNLWRIEPDAKMIRCEIVYASAERYDKFSEASRQMTLPIGKGFPGNVWNERAAVWIPDVAVEPDFLRAEAARAVGLHSAVGFPIRYNNTLCGVMECFSAAVETRDEILLQTLSAIGSQMGQFIERKHAHEQLKQTSHDLARSNTDLQQFAYVASHDLSEPLRMIVSYLQLLNDRHRAHLNSEAQEFMGYAVDGAKRMQAMIHDLLAYARVDSRGREFNRIESKQALEAALQNLKLVMQENAAVVLHDPLPTVCGDLVQLTQVFQNLISNAIKFRSPAPPQIEITVQRQNGEWQFAVKDNGLGIDQKNFDRIFVLFQRLHTRQEYPGTGIGLAVCKKIIERHGGRVWLESAAGKGTTFFFTLPVISEE